MFRKTLIKEDINKLPNNDISPEPVHIIKLIPTEPDLSRTPFGDTKIPLPF